MAFASCAWPCWTGNHGNVSLCGRAQLCYTETLMCVWRWWTAHTHSQFFMSFSHRGSLEIVSSCPLWLLILCPNNKYVGVMKQCLLMHKHTKPPADLLCLAATVLPCADCENMWDWWLLVPFHLGTVVTDSINNACCGYIYRAHISIYSHEKKNQDTSQQLVCSSNIFWHMDM